MCVNWFNQFIVEWLQLADVTISFVAEWLHLADTRLQFVVACIQAVVSVRVVFSLIHMLDALLYFTNRFYCCPPCTVTLTSCSVCLVERF